MRAAAALVLVLAASGCNCGDNINDGVDGGLIDAAQPDADNPIRCEVPAAGQVGGLCADTGTCNAPAGGGGLTTLCLDNNLSVPWPPGGFCTAFECTTDEECGEGNVCGQLSAGGTPFGACLPACCEGVGVGDVCSVGRICADTAFGEALGVNACLPGTPGIADGAPCSDFSACDVNSTCRDDPFQQPGGQCAVLNCADDTDCAPGGDGRCVNLTEDQVGAVCVDDCTDDSDCRTDEGYRCIDHGAPLGRFCRHPAPGDPCTADADCGTDGAGDPWVCRETNAAHAYADGYCTIEDCTVGDGDTCPIFSHCVSLDNEADTFCADECEMGSSSCGAGYQCAEVGTATGEFACIPDTATIDDPS